MFDKEHFDNVPKFNQFTYWFIRTSETTFDYGLAQSFLARSPQIEGQIIDKDTDSLPEIIQEEFHQFTLRPEYMIGKPVNINTSDAASNDQEMMVDYFEQLIVGSIFIRELKGKKHDPDTAIEMCDKFFQWIRSTDFYFCPASTKYHDAIPLGLLFHTLNVYNNIIELRKIKKFQSTDYASITLVALLHDLTKIGNYEHYLKNVKNETTGEWEKIPSYRWKDNPFPFGHGVTSMYIASQFFWLYIDELLAIRWHMAAYRVAKQDEGELEEANERYPIVRMIQFADQLACTKF